MHRAVRLCVLGLVTWACAAGGQLRPARTYYGINRPVPVEVARPAEAEGDLTIRLLTPGSAELARVACGEGGADLAALFEDFWADESNESVRYAQLFAGDKAVGPGLVLQPMVTPDQAYLLPREGVQWRTGPKFVSGLRVYVDKLAAMDTSEGTITFRMRPDMAPNTVWNFLSLADGGYYTDVIFHRIIGARNGQAPFVIQAGDPRGEGVGGPGYFIDLERSTLPHTFGVLSMARSSDPNSNGSQVFVCLSRERTQALDSLYTSFAEAIGGAEAILAIEKSPVGANDRPSTPPVILGVRLIDAAPRGTGPKPIARPAATSEGR